MLNSWHLGGSTILALWEMLESESCWSKLVTGGVSLGTVFCYIVPSYNLISCFLFTRS